VSLHCDCLSERLGAVPAQRTSGCSRSRGAPALHPLSQTAPLLTGEILKPCTVQMRAQNWFSLCTTSGLRFCDVSATLTTCYSNLSLLRPSSEMGISVSQLKKKYIYIYILEKEVSHSKHSNDCGFYKLGALKCSLLECSLLG